MAVRDVINAVAKGKLQDEQGCAGRLPALQNTKTGRATNAGQVHAFLL